jgi:hypothetical protein
MSDTDESQPTVTVPLDLLDCLLDSEPCWFDHNGGCQAHGYLSLCPGELCPQAELKQVLAAAAAEGACVAPEPRNVTPIPQVDDVLTVKQPGSAWDVCPSTPGARPTP